MENTEQISSHELAVEPPQKKGGFTLLFENPYLFGVALVGHRTQKIIQNTWLTSRYDSSRHWEVSSSVTTKVLSPVF
jgi:hypothetical protein